MSRPIEDRLRDAYEAKTGQLTSARLDQLTAAREQGLDGLLGGESEHTAELPVLDFDAAPTRKRQHHWIAPALAAAAVAALAIGVTAVAGLDSKPRPRPNPPATHVSTPPPSTSAPAPTSAPSATQTQAQTITAPPYLPAGQTGSRGQVPWSAVGSGWRLLQRQNAGDYATYDPKLYLYDPAGGRYLITAALPEQLTLLAWSPDGQRAMIEDNGTLRQLNLHSGRMVSQLTVPGAGFGTYTNPRGLAVLVENFAGEFPQLQRYSTDGTLELTYPKLPLLPNDALLYTPDGTRLVTDTTNGPILLSNDGQLIRQFSIPAGYSQCFALKWWTNSTVLEVCGAKTSEFRALYLQPLTGGRPSVLVDSTGPFGGGYGDAWQLSNGDVLLRVEAGCGYGGNEILDPRNGSIRPLKLPVGVAKPGRITHMDGDLATFQQPNYDGCLGGDQPAYSLIDYDMVTGQTRKLIDGLAILVNWPGDPS